MKKQAFLFIKNDNVNSYETVIHALMVICGHNPFQAEQCATIIDNTGEYCVSKGKYMDIREKCIDFIDLGIKAEIRFPIPTKKK